MKIFELAKYRFTKPNFKFEWAEAKRYPELSAFGEDTWVKEIGPHLGKEVSASDIGGVKNIKNSTARNRKEAEDEFEKLMPSKQKRAIEMVQKGVIEMPIVVKIGKDYDLVAGNTRLTAMVKDDIQPVVWLIDTNKFFK